MSRRISARLDAETAALVEELKLLYGWSNAEIVRRAITLLAVDVFGPVITEDDAGRRRDPRNLDSKRDS